MPDTITAVRSIGAPERRFITRVGQFLTQIVAPQYVGRAVAAGYDDTEHTEGWRLHGIAAGGDRPLQHAFVLRDLSATSNDRVEALLAQLDDFENRYFPIVQKIIRRKVPGAAAARFEGAFFDGLSQQPKGPGVIGSVSKLLSRVEALRTSEEAGAATVYQTLVKRSYLADADRAKHLLAELQQFAPAEPSPSAATVEEALRRQHEALAELRLWFSDWCTTLRPHYNLRERISLGMSRLRRSSSGTEEETDGDDDDDTSGVPS